MDQLVRNALFTTLAVCAGVLFILTAYALFAFPRVLAFPFVLSCLAIVWLVAVLVRRSNQPATH